MTEQCSMEGGGRAFVRRSLLQGSNVPASIPLALPKDMVYDYSSNTISRRELISTSSTENESLYLIPTALEMLESIEQPVAVLSICGPYRTGKSYILSRILGIQDAFQVGHTMKQCTRGLWLATTALQCENVVIVFLDSEGTDSTGSDLSYLNSLLVLTVLTSSMLIYNSKEIPRRSDLETMSFFAQLSTMVLASQNQQDEAFDFKQHFPTFHWLFRDSMLPLPLNEDGVPLTLTEYVRTEVLYSKESGSTSTQAQGVINALLHLFSSFECHRLPLPTTDPDLLSAVSSNESKLSERFNQEVQRLRSSLLTSIQPKHSQQSVDDDQYMNGPLLKTFVTTCLHSLGTRNVLPELCSGWEAALSSRMETILCKMVDGYTAELEDSLKDRGAIEESISLPRNTSSLLPICEDATDVDVFSPGSVRSGTLPRHRSPSVTSSMSLITRVQVTAQRTLIGIHQCILDKKIREFRKSLGAVSNEKKSQYLTRLEQQIVQYDKTEEGNCTGRVVGGVLLKYIQQNHCKSKERCNQLFDRIEEPLKNNLTREVDAMETDYYTLAIGPAKDEVFLERMREFDEIKSRLAPGPPRDLRVVGVAKDRIKIKWRRPKLHPRACLGYEVEVMQSEKQHKRGQWIKLITSTTWRAAMLTDLRVSTTYVFRVRGKNINQVGEWSDELVATTRIGEAGRYGASAAGFVGGTLSAPFVLTAETFKEGFQVYRESDSAMEKLHAGVGMVVGGLMLPVIILSEGLASTSRGIDIAESVYASTGTSEEDDLTERRTEVVSIQESISDVSTSSSSSDSVPAHLDQRQLSPAGHNEAETQHYTSSTETHHSSRETEIIASVYVTQSADHEDNHTHDQVNTETQKNIDLDATPTDYQSVQKEPAHFETERMITHGSSENEAVASMAPPTLSNDEQGLQPALNASIDIESTTELYNLDHQPSSPPPPPAGQLRGTLDDNKPPPRLREISRLQKCDALTSPEGSLTVVNSFVFTSD